LRFCDHSLDDYWTGLLSSTAQDDQGKLLEAEVPQQRSFKGTSQILPDAVANMHCSEVGSQRFLNMLNFALCTNHSLNPYIDAVLQHCISVNYDFGTAVSFVQRFWTRYPHDILSRHDIANNADADMRRNAVIGSLVKKDTPPRRLWDLHTNRIIPYHWAEMAVEQNVYAVSHSWCDESQLQRIHTRINCGQWNVPIPRSTSLAHIRIELLNLLWSTAVDLEEKPRYVWLDVLCLRQQSLSPQEEATRRMEWELDVPTIGGIFKRAARVLYYYSGLGQPFRLGDLDSDRHWINRAWTVQEATSEDKQITCGIVADSPTLGQLGSRFCSARDLVAESNGDILHLLRGILPRNASFEHDKIASLAHLVVEESDMVPCYITNESPDEAWARLVSCMDSKVQILLLELSRTNLYFWAEKYVSISGIYTLSRDDSHLKASSLSLDRIESGSLGNLPAHRKRISRGKLLRRLLCLNSDMHDHPPPRPPMVHHQWNSQASLINDSYPQWKVLSLMTLPQNQQWLPLYRRQTHISGYAWRHCRILGLTNRPTTTSVRHGTLVLPHGEKIPILSLDNALLTEDSHCSVIFESTAYRHIYVGQIKGYNQVVTRFRTKAILEIAQEDAEQLQKSTESHLQRWTDTYKDELCVGRVSFVYHGRLELPIPPNVFCIPAEVPARRPRHMSTS
jgi:hypothetical protein